MLTYVTLIQTYYVTKQPHFQYISSYLYQTAQNWLRETTSLYNSHLTHIHSNTLHNNYCHTHTTAQIQSHCKHKQTQNANPNQNRIKQKQNNHKHHTNKQTNKQKTKKTQKKQTQNKK